MQNPPKRPKVPAGKQAVWIPPLFIRAWTTDFDTGFSYWSKAVVRRGHYRVVSVSRRTDAARSSGKLWVPAGAFEHEMQIEYDLGGLDPVYRHHRGADFVRSLSSVLDDPIHGLVWGIPFAGDNLKGTFSALRTWYIVRDMNLDRFYLYGRTAQVGNRTYGSLVAVRGGVRALETEIVHEYEEKAYMELVRFVAWTAYGKANVVRRHGKFRKISKERGFDFDPKRFKFRRVVTRWEREQAQGALRGVSGVPPVLARNYGGSYKRFTVALAKSSKGERRRAYEYLAWAVGKMEKALDKRRKARKPGKWRE